MDRDSVEPPILNTHRRRQAIIDATRKFDENDPIDTGETQNEQDLLSQAVNQFREKHQLTLGDVAEQLLRAKQNSRWDMVKKKGTIALMKKLETRGSRAKPHENVMDIETALKNMSRSCFEDTYLMTFEGIHWSDLIAPTPQECRVHLATLNKIEWKRREAIWELFTSELKFLLHHLVVLKHCFYEPLKRLQVDGHFMYLQPSDLFGNIDELCNVSHTFCRDLASCFARKDDATTVEEFGKLEPLMAAFQKWTTASREGSVFHRFCLNYHNALSCLQTAQKEVPFQKYQKYCEQDARCHRLKLTDLLVSPLQHYTKIPLLLNAICNYTINEKERILLKQSLEKVENSLKLLEEKMEEFQRQQRMQMLNDQLVWPLLLPNDQKQLLPEVIQQHLNSRMAEFSICSDGRYLLFECSLRLHDGNKLQDAYGLLFTDMFLLVKVKKVQKKKSIHSSPYSLYQREGVSPIDGAVLRVLRHPARLDRIYIVTLEENDVTINESIKHGFIIVEETVAHLPLNIFLIECSSQSEKNRWLEELSSAHCESLKHKPISDRISNSDSGTSTKADSQVNSDTSLRYDSETPFRLFPHFVQTLSKLATSPDKVESEDSGTPSPTVSHRRTDSNTQSHTKIRHRDLELLYSATFSTPATRARHDASLLRSNSTQDVPPCIDKLVRHDPTHIRTVSISPQAVLRAASQRHEQTNSTVPSSPVTRLFRASQTPPSSTRWTTRPPSGSLFNRHRTLTFNSTNCVSSTITSSVQQQLDLPNCETNAPTSHHKDSDDDNLSLCGQINSPTIHAPSSSNPHINFIQMFRSIDIPDTSRNTSGLSPIKCGTTSEKPSLMLHTSPGANSPQSTGPPQKWKFWNIIRSRNNRKPS